MRTRFRWFFAGVFTSLLVFALIATAYAAYEKSATLYYNDISVTLDGQKIALKDANGSTVDPFIVDGTTYLPIRAVANALDLNVDWNSQTKTVLLSHKAKAQSSSSSQPSGNSGSVVYPVHLYSYDMKVYLGKLVTNEYDTDSIWNPYGEYGSKYESNSIWNPYGEYGSKYSTKSPFNAYTSTPPVIIDNEGYFLGYLTDNKYLDPSYTIEEVRQILINNHQ